MRLPSEVPVIGFRKGVGTLIKERGQRSRSSMMWRPMTQWLTLA